MARQTTRRFFGALACAFGVVLAADLTAPVGGTTAVQQLNKLFLHLKSRNEILQRINAIRAEAARTGNALESDTGAPFAGVELDEVCVHPELIGDDVLKVMSAIKDDAEQRAEQTRKRSDERLAALECAPEKALESDRQAARAFRKLAKKQLEQILAANIEDQTVFLFGASSEVFVFAAKARRVIVIEKDPDACDKFLASALGICSLKDNVHIFCMKHNSLGERERLMAFFSMAESLIQDQYSDIPLDVLHSDMNYPVALALKIFEEIDQSTTLVLRHRLSHAALEVLGKYYRQVLLVLPDEMDPDVTNSASVLLLRKKYVPDPPPNLWESFVSPEWQLAPREEPMVLFRDLVSQISERFQHELDELENTRLGIQARAIRSHYHLATDEERQGDIAFLDELRTTLDNPQTHFATVQELFRRRSQEVADIERSTSVLKEYFEPLDKAIAAMPEDSMKHLLQDMQNDFVVATNRIDTTDSQLELLEDILELLNPELFTSSQLLPKSLHALRLAVASLNIITDAHAIVRDIEETVFRGVDPVSLVKA
ncbi:conserved hypothetical protein [Neospora caninum Liverpool]|uniref:Transmembrane protein n=1 Tax=Neospora caninum (strain Liverpool) TaxID=572307 RepID=F0VG06_NEOCL|nr:conserved hypothetical protein [Neospora caninum Liverpool]CBZ52650.1 conserved hypothetical protein [Neospora caninum Liverpool]CEL66627.1 TPA: hypothetical protein BN1204_024380 [Neospora caninum Liverpool]|eukprot:XP_003882682.1 conserved hypothetical protein [Neospora caninum Liverpool]